jgi:hypothetical protein
MSTNPAENSFNRLREGMMPKTAICSFENNQRINQERINTIKTPITTVSTIYEPAQFTTYP